MAQIESSESNMLPHELTLIVAATNQMGIGKAGTLPWTGLKKEMAYFARITKRAAPGKSNAVIMGRRTWDSIPPKFRPLKDRTNYVLTKGSAEPKPGVGLAIINSVDKISKSLAAKPNIEKAFVIGGAQIYEAALEMKEAKRILLTRVLNDFVCDTAFPVILREDGTAEGWERKSKEELDQWTGETVPEGVQEENGTRYVFEMWGRKND